MLSDHILRNLQASTSSRHDAEIEVFLVLTIAVMWKDYSFVWKRLILRHGFDVQSQLLLLDAKVVIVMSIEALLMMTMYRHESL